LRASLPDGWLLQNRVLLISRPVGECELLTKPIDRFGHPALVAANVRGNPQCKAFLAKQSVATVTRTENSKSPGFQGNERCNFRYYRALTKFLLINMKMAVQARERPRISLQTKSEKSLQIILDLP
jgi:hypothetical protein